jgi:hypothetical protein
MDANRSLIAILVAAVVSACGGGDEGNGDGDGDGALPTGESSASIQSFLDEEAYTGAGWTAETSEPRAASNVVSPHGSVRVYLNGAAAASPRDNVAQENASAVKELYDDADALVGIAMIWQTGTTSSDVLYYCFGPAGRCSTASPERTKADPILGFGVNVDCGSCHGGTIFTELAQ